MRCRPALRAIGCDVTVTLAALTVVGMASRLSTVRPLVPDEVSVEKTYAPVAGTVRMPVHVTVKLPVAPESTDGIEDPQLKLTVPSVRLPAGRFGSTVDALYAPARPCMTGPWFPLDPTFISS